MISKHRESHSLGERNSTIITGVPESPLPSIKTIQNPQIGRSQSSSSLPIISIKPTNAAQETLPQISNQTKHRMSERKILPIYKKKILNMFQEGGRVISEGSRLLTESPKEQESFQNIRSSQAVESSLPRIIEKKSLVQDDKSFITKRSVSKDNLTLNKKEIEYERSNKECSIIVKDDSILQYQLEKDQKQNSTISKVLAEWLHNSNSPLTYHQIKMQMQSESKKNAPGGAILSIFSGEQLPQKKQEINIFQTPKNENQQVKGLSPSSFNNSILKSSKFQKLSPSNFQNVSQDTIVMNDTKIDEEKTVIINLENVNFTKAVHQANQDANNLQKKQLDNSPQLNSSPIAKRGNKKAEILKNIALSKVQDTAKINQNTKLLQNNQSTVQSLSQQNIPSHQKRNSIQKLFPSSNNNNNNNSISSISSNQVEQQAYDNILSSILGIEKRKTSLIPINNNNNINSMKSPSPSHNYISMKQNSSTLSAMLSENGRKNTQEDILEFLGISEPKININTPMKSNYLKKRGSSKLLIENCQKQLNTSFKQKQNATEQDELPEETIKEVKQTKYIPVGKSNWQSLIQQIPSSQIKQFDELQNDKISLTSNSKSYIESSPQSRSYKGQSTPTRGILKARSPERSAPEVNQYENQERDYLINLEKSRQPEESKFQKDKIKFNYSRNNFHSVSSKIITSFHKKEQIPDIPRKKSVNFKETLQVINLHKGGAESIGKLNEPIARNTFL